jgi:hypothetical protein
MMLYFKINGYPLFRPYALIEYDRDSPWHKLGPTTGRCKMRGFGSKIEPTVVEGVAIEVPGSGRLLMLWLLMVG